MTHRILRTGKDFEFWMSRAKTGDTIIYHIGDLAYDRLGYGEGAHIIDELGATAWEYARTEEVHLLQRKLADNRYEYLAIKTMPKNMTRLKIALRRPLPASKVDGAIRSSAQPITL